MELGGSVGATHAHDFVDAVAPRYIGEVFLGLLNGLFHSCIGTLV